MGAGNTGLDAGPGAGLSGDELRRLREDCAFDEAERLIDDRLRGHPGDTAALYELVRLRLAQHRPDEALAVLDALPEPWRDEDRAAAWRIACLHRLFRHEEAYAAAERARARFPDSREVLRTVTRLAIGRSRYDEALDATETLLRAVPGDSAALADRLWLLGRLGRWTETDERTREAVRLRPEDPELLADCAVALIEAGVPDPDRAVGLVDRALRADPVHWWALEVRIYVLRALRRWDEAERAVDEALAARPRLIGVLDEARVLAAARGRPEEALGHAGTARAIDPAGPRTTEAWIEALADAGRQDEALAAAEAFTADRPEDGDRWTLLVSLLRETDPDRALEACERGLERDPEHAGLLTERSETLRSLHRWEEAGAAARRACDSHPRLPRPRAELAWAEAGLGRTDQALAAFEAALERDPRSYAALLGRIRLLRRASRWAEAEETARRLVALRPYESRRWVWLGEVLWDQDRDEEALAAFEAAAAEDPDDQDLLGWRLAGLRVCGRPEEARALAEENLRAHPEDPDVGVELARLLEDRGEKAAALARVEAVLRAHPGHDASRYVLLRLLSALDRAEEAERAAESLVADRPGSAAAHLALARLRSARGRPEEGLAPVDRALALDPGSPEALELRIELLCDTRRWDEAVEAGRAAVEAWPDHIGLRIGMTDALEGRGLTAEALTHYDRVLLADPGHTGVLLARTRALGELRRWDEAERFARQSAERLPDVADCHMALAETLIGRHRPGAALDALAEAVRLAPHRTMPRMRTVEVLRDLGRFTEAEEAACEALRACPDGAASLRVNLGHLRLGRGRAAEALASFDEALRLAPGNNWAQRSRAIVLRRLRRWEEAERAALAAVESHPREPYCHLVLADVYENWERPEQQLAACERACAADPCNPWAMVQRVEALRAMRRWTEAEAAAREAVRRRPDDPSPLIASAGLLTDRGRHAEALERLDEALRLDPDDSWALDRRLHTLRSLGRHEQATREAREKAERYPEWTAARRMLARSLAAQGLHREALEEWERVVRAEPHASANLCALSSTLRSLHCHEEAEQLLRPAFADQPHALMLGAELAMVLYERGDHEAAVELLDRLRSEAAGPEEKALFLDGTGWVRLDQGRYEDALRSFEEAARLDPADEDYTVSRAWALLRLGGADNLREADRLCREALAEAGSVTAGAAHVCRGMVAYRQLRLAEAEQHFRRAVAADPYGVGRTDLGALLVELGRHDEAETVLESALASDESNVHALVELGNLRLQRAQTPDTPEGATEHAAGAVRLFRRALRLRPGSRSAAIGLALSLVTSSGALSDAEEVLRAALRESHETEDRRLLHLALARLLLHTGDCTQRALLYEEAVDEAGAALRLNSGDPEASFVAGLAEQRLAADSGDVRLRSLHRARAVAHFRRCARRDSGHVEVRRALRLLEEEAAMARGGRLGSVVLVLMSVAVLAATWADFLWGDRVTAVMVSTLTPVLAGLVVLGLLMPLLVRVKLPGGMEADLSASLREISQGPTGEVGANVLRFPTGAGPVGELPRL